MIIFTNIREIDNIKDKYNVDNKNIYLCCRFPPVNFKYNNLIELAPSKDIILKYKHSVINWVTYVISYRLELMNKASLIKVSELSKESLDNNIILSCYCNDISKCHLLILSNLFIEMGVEVIR